MPTPTHRRPHQIRHRVDPEAEAIPVSIVEEINAAHRAVDIAERELAAAHVFLDGLRRESCPTNDPAYVGGKLRLHIAGTVALEAAAWLRAVRRRHGGES